MNILILVNSFPPEIGSSSHLFYELSTTLVGRGHQVTVLTNFPERYTNQMTTSGHKKSRIYIREEMDGVQVIRLKSLPFSKKIPFMRIVEHMAKCISYSIAAMKCHNPDVLLVYSPPLPFGLSAALVGKLRRIPFILNVQDIYPQCAIDLGLLKNPLLIRMAYFVEKVIYSNASYITVHSDGNKQKVLERVDDEDKVKVIPNWVDTNFIKPADQMNNFRKRLGVNNKFIVSFAGKMGFAQDMDTIIESAHQLKSKEEILFLLIGDGISKEDAVDKANNLALSNIRFLPLQPREEYPSILNASDLCLATLKEDIQTPVIPGKIINIMASGRPVVASMNLEGDAAQLIKDADCGICVPPEDPNGLSEAILTLYEKQNLRTEMGKNGREYAENHFSRKACVSKYETLLTQASNSQ